MKKMVLLIGVIVCLSAAKAQTSDSTHLNNTKEEVLTFAEQMPEFIGGDDAMYLFFKKNIIYPPLALSYKIEGRVLVTFVVGIDGKIEQIEQVGQKLGWGCDEEAIRVINTMPNWKPGKLKGKPVKVKYTIPIRFKL